MELVVRPDVGRSVELDGSLTGPRSLTTEGSRVREASGGTDGASRKGHEGSSFDSHVDDLLVSFFVTVMCSLFETMRRGREGEKKRETMAVDIGERTLLNLLQHAPS